MTRPVVPDGQRAFGARVAELRAERGLTQRELAAEIGRTTSWLSQVERGRGSCLVPRL
ncbi:helix-turn-helix domain-containing protein [Streptomyces griseocarneus]|uniref:helix-turn-helix domain-containing protein n=1 Tax=Streptomyces griseocarneus TaxID=51201 RepID=UPI0027DF1AEB|nr:helix-turn-helix transcriptional regulator [Streptomyces griseocarneus]